MTDSLIDDEVSSDFPVESYPKQSSQYGTDKANDLESQISQILEMEPISLIDSNKKAHDEIPDKFSGWGLTSVIGCAFFNFNTWGANSAYALYLQHYLSNNTFKGADKYSYSTIGGLAFGTGLIFSPIINYIIGIVGIKPTIFFGIIVYFAAVMMASFATRLWELYLTQGCLAGVGMAFICVANINILPQWFKGGKGGKRNLAMGIQAAGSGAGGIVYNLGMQQLLKNKSYHWSLRAQAIMCIGLNLISLLLVKSRNDNIKPVFKVYDRLIWTNFGCLLLILWVMFTLLGYVTMMYNLGDFTKSLGYSSQQGSIVSSMISVGIIYGRPIVGWIGDLIGPVNVTIIASWLVALFSLAMWIPCRNYATAIVFALFVGSLMGTIWLTAPTMNAQIVGLKKFGIAMSINWISVGVFGLVSPIIGIALKKDGPVSPTQYQPASIFVGLCYFMAGVVLMVVRGWLIARNTHVLDEKLCQNEDDLLKVKVGFSETIRSMFLKERV